MCSVQGQERPIDQDYKNAFYYAVNELAGLGKNYTNIYFADFYNFFLRIFATMQK